MIAVVSDTHGQADPRLAGRTAAAVDAADVVVHAGDFVREAVLDAFAKRSSRLVAVYGNVDDDAVRGRLAERRTISVDGATIALTHTISGGPTGLATFGRARGADLVIFGHSHRPGYEWTGELGLLNPGSHAQPRGHRAAHAELEVADGRLTGRLVTVEGETFARFEIDLH